MNFLSPNSPSEELERRVEQRTAQLKAANAELRAEVAERRAAQEALHASQRRLQLSLDATRTAYWEVNLKTGEVTTIAPSVSWLGYQPEEIKADRAWWKSLTHPEDVDVSEKALCDYLEGRTDTYECEYRVRGKSGQWFWTHDRGKVVRRDADGTPLLMAGTDTDVTECKHTEQSLRTSEERFRSVFEQAGVAVGIVDSRSGRFLQINRKYEELIGYSNPEATQKTWMDISHPDDIQEDLDNMRDLGEGKIREFSMEKRLIHKNGSVIWIELTVSPIGNPGEEPAKHIVIVEDITEQRRAEQSLRASEERNRRLLNGSQDIIWETRIEGLPAAIERLKREEISVSDLFEGPHPILKLTPTYVSPATIPILGLTPEQVLARSFDEKFTPNNKLETLRSVAEHIAIEAAGGPAGPWTVEHEEIHRDGSIVYTEGIMQFIRNEQGDPVGLFGTSRDITARKQLEEEVRLQQEKLAHVGRLSMMGEMATGLAHELNQPLTAILNSCYVGERALEGPRAADPARLLALFKNLTEQSIRAGQIIRRLRDFVSKRSPVRSPVNITEPIQEVLRLLDLDLRQKDIRVELRMNHASALVIIDEIQIQQVLINLIRNASDAMSEVPSDERVLSITTLQTADDTLETAVCDTGQGVPLDKKDQVFDAFFSTKSEGMGMGLAISRTIIESHGGRFWMRPNTERGVTFYFTLPLATEAVIQGTEVAPGT